MKIRTAVVFASILIWPQFGLAALVWDWSIINPVQAVGPNEVITFEAIIANDASSTVIMQNLDEHVDESASGGIVFDRLSLIAGASQEIFDFYDFDIGPIGSATLQSQFAGVELLPGEAFEFTLLSMVPGNGPIPSSVYTKIFTSISVNVDGSFSFLLGDPVEVTVVPVPSAALLFVGPLLLVSSLCRRKNEF